MNMHTCMHTESVREREGEGERERESRQMFARINTTSTK